MKKLKRLYFKKVRNLKNRRRNNKGVILGNKKLLGRHYKGGASSFISLYVLKLADMLQKHDNEVSTKVGWMLTKIYWRAQHASDFQILDALDGTPWDDIFSYFKDTKVFLLRELFNSCGLKERGDWCVFDVKDEEGGLLSRHYVYILYLLLYIFALERAIVDNVAGDDGNLLQTVAKFKVNFENKLESLKEILKETGGHSKRSLAYYEVCMLTFEKFLAYNTDKDLKVWKKKADKYAFLYIRSERGLDHEKFRKRFKEKYVIVDEYSTEYFILLGLVEKKI